MTSRERVIRTIKFQGADRIPLDLPDPYGSDFAWMSMHPHPDSRPPNGPDEWGSVWENIGICKMGEVQDFPIKIWDDFDRMQIPDVSASHRWADQDKARANAGDKFLLSNGISIYERAHFLRGLENIWCDIYEEPENLKRLLDVLVEMNLYAIKRYAEFGADGYIFCDDWGLQDRLMIPPESWREIWKPCYARIYQAAHDAGLLTFLHSCGYIMDILDDLIEIGLDVIHMDQQENMGLETLGRRFGGRLTFYAPVDIQNTMANGSLEEIREYCHAMARHLGRPNGGFIARWYGDPVGAGHTPEALECMCKEFVKISTFSSQKI